MNEDEQIREILSYALNNEDKWEEIFSSSFGTILIRIPNEETPKVEKELTLTLYCLDGDPDTNVTIELEMETVTRVGWWIFSRTEYSNSTVNLKSANPEIYSTVRALKAKLHDMEMAAYTNKKEKEKEERINAASKIISELH